jgi:hypothetical protein
MFIFDFVIYSQATGNILFPSRLALVFSKNFWAKLSDMTSIQNRSDSVNTVTAALGIARNHLNDIAAKGSPEANIKSPTTVVEQQQKNISRVSRINDSSSFCHPS